MSGAGRAAWLAALAALAVAVRLPYWFDAVVGRREMAGWDESTFIIVAQSVLDGELLYTSLADVKPPLLFYAFAAALVVFGEDIAAVRAFGTLAVFLTGAVTFLIAERCGGRIAAAIAGSLCITTLSVTGEAQAVLSEHVAVLPMMAALLLLGRPSPGAAVFFAAGLLLGAAVFVRTNLAVAALVVALLLPLHPDMAGLSARLRAVAWYGLGGAAALLGALAPHLIAGEAALWWRMVVEAPLAYAGGQSSPISKLPKLLTMVYLQLRPETPLHIAQALLAVPGLWLLPRMARRLRIGGWYPALLLVTSAAVAASILASRSGYPHYLLQIWPFAALLAGITVAWLTARIGRRVAVPLTAVALACLFPVLLPVAQQYRKVVVRVADTGSLHAGRTRAIAACVAALPLERPSVFALSDHLVYWYLGARPPTPLAVHPSAMFRPYLVRGLAGPEQSVQSQLRLAFAARPAVVVTRPSLWYLSYLGTERSEVEALLAELLAPYRQVALIDGTEILVHRDALTQSDARPSPACAP